MTELTEQEIDDCWPVLAQVVRAIEWHAETDVESFCKSWALEMSLDAQLLDDAEAELARLPGRRIVEIMRTDPGETCADAPKACTFLTRYFN